MKKLYAHPLMIVLIFAVLTVFFALQLPKIKINNDLYVFLGDHNEAKIENEEVEKVFGETEALVVAVESKYQSILAPENLSLIDSLTALFQTLPHVNNVLSLTHADFLNSTNEGMTVEQLIPDSLRQGPQSSILARLQSWEDMYRNNLYDKDLRSTQLLLEIDTGLQLPELEAIYHGVMDQLKPFERNDVNFYVAGVPAIAVVLKESMFSDMFRLIPFVVLVVILTLFLSFRTMAGVLLPLLNVVVSSVWTIGLMALFNIPMTMVSTAIPVILISVGSAYGIHLLSHTYDAVRQNPGENFQLLLMKTVKKVGIPVLLAGLTTVAGFASLSTSAIEPLRDSGFFLAIGVLVAIAAALFLVPAILLLRHRPIKQDDNEIHEPANAHTLMDRFLLAFYDLFTRHNYRNLLITLVLLILSVFGTHRILLDTNMIGTFRPTTDIAVSNTFQNDHFGGTVLLNVVVDGKKPGSLLEPDILKAMDDLSAHLENDVALVGKVTSFTKFVKRMNQVMNRPVSAPTSLPPTSAAASFKEESGFSFDDIASDNEKDENSSFSFEEDVATPPSADSRPASVERPAFPKPDAGNILRLLNRAVENSGKSNPTADDLIHELNKLTNEDGAAYYEIPWDPSKYPAHDREELINLIAQYLLLYRGSLKSFINDPLEPSQARMIVQVKSPMNADAASVEKVILDYAAWRFPAGYDIKVTGVGKMSASVNEMTISSQTSSIISSLLIVFAIIAISFRSVVAGFFGIITLIFSLMINFGVMGFFHIKLDLGTSMVASVAIGIGIDYTIHFLSRYRMEARKSADERIITQKTLLTAGKAILFNALSVGAGFAVLIRSNFIPIQNLGLLIALTMATSSLGALTLLPAMIHTFKPKFLSLMREK